MNNKNHFEQLRASVAQQKSATKPKPSTSSSAGLRLAESLTNTNSGAFRPKTGIPAVRERWKELQSQEVRNPNLAPANTVNKMAGTYKSGDGDTPVYYRPGSLDFMQCPSKGLRC